jgi:integrase
MVHVPHTKLRNGVYWFQRQIPRALVGHSIWNGKKCVEHSLRTKDASVALRRVNDALDDFEAKCEVARGRAIAAASSTSAVAILRRGEMDAETIKHCAWRHFQTHVDADRRARLNAGDAPEGLEAAYLRDYEDNRLPELATRRETLARTRSWVLVKDSADLYFRTEGLEPIPDLASYRALCQALVEAEVASIDQIAQQARGVLTAEPASELIRTAPKTRPSINRQTIDTVYAHYCQVHPPGVRWEEKALPAIKLFRDHFGANADFLTISREDLLKYILFLRQIPASASKRFRGMSIRQAIDANDARPDPYPRVHPTTVKADYMAVISRLFSFACEAGIRKDNPALRLFPKTNKRVAKVRGGSFREEELVRLFQQPIFQGCESDRKRREPGKHLVSDHFFWAPILGYYTGARASEIGQLRVKDVRLDDKFPHLVIEASAEEGMRVKTEAARRLVPIRQEVLELGFAEYVSSIKGVRLFPNWLADKKTGKFSDSRSQRFFRDELIPEITDRVPKPNFHSFRHFMKDVMRENGMQEAYQRSILGHEQEGMDAVYGSEIPMRALYPAMAQMKFPVAIHAPRRTY